MKKHQIFSVISFITLSVFLLFYACNKKDHSIAPAKLNKADIDHYRKSLNSNSLKGKEFYKALNKYEELVRDSIISFSIKENASSKIALKGNYYTTTIKFCSISGRIGNTGNGLLLQTGSNSNGKVVASAFGISGQHGNVSQVGSLEQGSSHQGVSTIRIYLQGSYSTSGTYSSSFGGSVGAGNTSVNATSGYSATSGGFQSNLFLVSVNMQNGCPIAMSTIPVSPDTLIEPIP